MVLSVYFLVQYHLIFIRYHSRRRPGASRSSVRVSRVVCISSPLLHVGKILSIFCVFSLNKLHGRLDLSFAAIQPYRQCRPSIFSWWRPSGHINSHHICTNQPSIRGFTGEFATLLVFSLWKEDDEEIATVPYNSKRRASVKYSSFSVL